MSDLLWNAPDQRFPWQAETRFAWDLQRFAAEDEGRTEDPTEAKIRKAREEGKVAKSQDITGAVELLLPIVLIAFLSGYFWTTLIEMIRFYLAQATTLDPITGGGVLSGSFYLYMVRLLLPVLGVAFVAAAAANFLQVGVLFTLKPIIPDFKRIVPKFGQWLKRSLFSTEVDEHFR